MLERSCSFRSLKHTPTKYQLPLQLKSYGSHRETWEGAVVALLGSMYIVLFTYVCVRVLGYTLTRISR